MGSSRRRVAVVVAAFGALAAAGCGEDRQDADAPSGRFDVEVIEASFPAEQRISESAKLTLEVANRGDRAIPNLAVTVETEPAEDGQAATAFAQESGDSALADAARPVWILDEGPGGGDSAYTNTWAVGPVAKGATRSVVWEVTAIQPGDYTVAWRLAPALAGDAELGGERTEGEFDVSISQEPVPARVGEDGEVVRGEEAGR